MTEILNPRKSTTPLAEDFVKNDGHIKIISHGDWVRYVPEVNPVAELPNVMFAKRTTDDKDWYDFIRDPDNFGPASILALTQLVNGKFIIQGVFVDRSFGFPANMRVLEIQGYNGSLDAVHKLWEQKYYDPINGVIGDPILNLDDLYKYAQSQKKVIEEGGITVGGYPVATDRASQAMITQTVLSIQLNPNIRINWKGPDGKFTVLNNDTIKFLAMQVITHVARTFDVLAMVSEKIESHEIGDPDAILAFLKENIPTTF